MFRLKLSEVLDMGDMSFRIVVYNAIKELNKRLDAYVGINRLDTKVNLCDSCTKNFADCDADYPYLGNGIGNDNVYYCDSYDKCNEPEKYCETCGYAIGKVWACDCPTNIKCSPANDYRLWIPKVSEHNCDTCKSTYGCMYCDDCESYDKWWQDVPIDKPVSEIPNEAEVVSSSHYSWGERR